jgi:hypothetical protein
MFRCFEVVTQHWAVLVRSAISLSFQPRGSVLTELHSNRSRCSVLKTACPERFTDMVPVRSGLSPSSSFSARCKQKIREWSMLLCLRLLLRVQSLLSLRRGPTPSQCPDTHFPRSNGSPDCLLCNSCSTVCLKVLLSILLLPRRNRSFRPRFLMPLLHSGCARHRFLQGFLLQRCPCLVPDDRVPYAVPFLHRGSSVCGRRSTSSGTYHCLGSISSTVGDARRLDAGPHTTPSVL